MLHVMYSTRNEDMNILNNLDPYTQLIYMQLICHWVINRNNKRTVIIKLKALQLLSSIKTKLTESEVIESLSILQRRKLLDIISKSDKKFEIELAF